MSMNIAIAGASGYAGGEALRLLLAHPEFVFGSLQAHSSRGPVRDHHPHLPIEQELEGLNAERLAEADAVILALPHGASGKLAAEVAELNPDVFLVDLGADHRLENPADWAAFYPGEHAGSWTYAMPELIGQRERLAGARRLAAPGCNASAVTFAAQPALAAGIAEPDVVAVLAVGYSGAGKSLKPHLLASEATGSLAPYQVGGIHRHIPEIAQNLSRAGVTAHVSLTPVLAPVSRGILATVSMPAAPGTTQDDVDRAYDLYAGEPFVTAASEPPSTGPITGSNLAPVCARLDKDGRRITAVCAIDNLVKGTAGAAIQSMNLALGLPETLGLPAVGVAP
ncbi:MAG: N-acetyl-gamma-glutamyl-phosphate reductase [Flaviflexus sp.]|nr:N-acetyl-gamma-glutamyl-phosphate reductase [Flaviflexus sp.]